MRGFTGNPVRIVRDEEDIDTYRVDLSDWLAGDTLATVTVTKEVGVTVDSAEIIATPVSIPNYGSISASSALAITLSGGVQGVAGVVQVKVTTAQGRARVVGYAVDAI